MNEHPKTSLFPPSHPRGAISNRFGVHDKLLFLGLPDNVTDDNQHREAAGNYQAYFFHWLLFKKRFRKLLVLTGFRQSRSERLTKFILYTDREDSPPKASQEQD